ncbi:MULTISPECIES: hypothetical protein [Lysinibacillus]|uniref:Uncharacterized protein n=1 Tax=Lysinibacillus antri TaxID=2498145 RepID=A0A3S0PPE0_9BACI|nr:MULTISPECIES: hypothetical protein [Lysinibacillus]RUL52017.1 hypothetical protein EK386_10495 [Lysinibacillus antri]TSI05950.1 hypothetical protein FJQ64_11110 [Lysinibacillus sp. BW-2-10]
MMLDRQKLVESQTVVKKIANGINPIDDTPFNDTSFLTTPQVIQPIFYLFNYMFHIANGNISSRQRPKQFFITNEQLDNVVLPEGKIGIMEFAKAINEVIDPTISKKLNGAMINKKLKELQILSEAIDEEGHRRTITNENSEAYGIESVTKSFRGREYQKVVFNEVGKQFLLKNLKQLMN